METSTPVVDFSQYGVQLHERDVEKIKNIDSLASELVGAFKDIGFVYIINHGIDKSRIDAVNACTEQFFSLPVHIKARYARPGDENHGWVGLETENLNPTERTWDYKELYNVTPWRAKVWPDDVVPGFQQTLTGFYSDCYQLAHCVLDIMARGLELQDVNFFSKRHSLDKPSYTTLRCLNYPPLPKKQDIKPNQIRCGEHSDYGSITLLFQDDMGGLEVCNRQGTYGAATPVSGAVIVNVGDLMQRWTSDVLISTKHRVVIPEEETKRNQGRQSIAFFVHPDDDCMVQCVDGSDRYPPVNAAEYSQMRLAPTY